MTHDEFHARLVLMGYKPRNLDMEGEMVIVYPATGRLPMKVMYNKWSGVATSALQFSTENPHLHYITSTDLLAVFDFTVDRSFP